MYFNFQSCLLLLAALSSFIIYNACSLDSTVNTALFVALCISLPIFSIKALDWAYTTATINGESKGDGVSKLKTKWARISNRTIYSTDSFHQALRREKARPGSIKVGTRFINAIGYKLIISLHKTDEDSPQEVLEVLEMIKTSAFVPYSVYAEAVILLSCAPERSYLEDSLTSVLSDSRLSYLDLRRAKYALDRAQRSSFFQDALLDYGSEVAKTSSIIFKNCRVADVIYSPKAERIASASVETQEIFRTLLKDHGPCSELEDFSNIVEMSYALSGR